MTWRELQLLNTQADLISLSPDERVGYSLSAPTEFAQDLLGTRGPYFLKLNVSGVTYVTFTPHFINVCIVAMTDECTNNMIPAESELWFAYVLYLKEIDETSTSSLTGVPLLIMETLDARLIAEIDGTYSETEIVCPVENI